MSTAVVGLAVVGQAVVGSTESPGDLGAPSLLPPVAWPYVKAKLVEELPGVVGPSVTVFDGPVVTGANPTAYVTVGHQPSVDAEGGGDFTQDPGPDGFFAIETGTVLCEVGATTGATEIPDAFGIFALIAAWIHANQTLGGTLAPGSTCTASANVLQAQTRSGAVQRLVVSISYFTRL